MSYEIERYVAVVVGIDNLLIHDRDSLPVVVEW